MQDLVQVVVASGSASNDSHLHLYADIARRLGFAPTRQMLDCLPEAGPLMFLRDDPVGWAEARSAVHLLCPDIPAWTSKVTADGNRLASVPERVVYDVLNQICPRDIQIKTHPWFMDLFKADLALVRGQATVFIEVLGMLLRGREPHNSTAETYRRRTDRTLSIYAKHGVWPTLIYLDDICCDPARLRALLRGAIEQLAEAA